MAEAGRARGPSFDVTGFTPVTASPYLRIQPRLRKRERRGALLSERRMHPPPVLDRPIFEANLPRREPDVAGPPEPLEESPVLKTLLASQGSHGPLLAAIFLHCQNYLAVLGSSAGLT